MVQLRQLAVRCLDFGVRRLSCDAQYLIIIRRIADIIVERGSSLMMATGGVLLMRLLALVMGKLLVLAVGLVLVLVSEWILIRLWWGIVARIGVPILESAIPVEAVIGVGAAIVRCS